MGGFGRSPRPNGLRLHELSGYPSTANQPASPNKASAIQGKRDRFAGLSKSLGSSHVAAAAMPGNVASPKSATFRFMRSDSVRKHPKTRNGNVPPAGDSLRFQAIADAASRTRLPMMIHAR